MSQWAKVQQLPSDTLRRVYSLYGDHFPIEIRATLAQWLEGKLWHEIEPDNPQHETFATTILANMLQELEGKIAVEENFVVKFKLQESLNLIRNNYVHNPLQFVRTVKLCLMNEVKIFEEAESCLGLSSVLQEPLNPQQEITIQLERLQLTSQQAEEDLRTMNQEQENFVIHYQESLKRQAQLQQANAQNIQANEVIAKMQRDKDALDQALRSKASSLVQMRVDFVQRHCETIMQLETVQARVLQEELHGWKRNQQLNGNGAVFNNNLDQIQLWCESLAELIWQYRQQIGKVQNLCSTVPISTPSALMERLSALNTQITNLLSYLIYNTFVIEKQPPQVMKTNTRFVATVRLLVGGKLNLNMTPPHVTVSIINEVQANNILRTENISNEQSGDILNTKGTMEYNQTTRQLSITFRNMQLRRIKRMEKKGTESVMDEKFALLFQTHFKVGNEEYHVWVLSLPVVVIVHGNQEPHAWATVTWDNAFSEPVYSATGSPCQSRVPFAVPDKVPWHKLAEVLRMKFKSAVGGELSPENLVFLAGKVFRNHDLSDYTNVMLSWSQFCKEPLPDRSFTFWEWFYAIMKVTKDHLKSPWEDGLIMGFVARKHADDILRQCHNGTFLLRFSDSELGGLSVASVSDGQGDQREVYMIQPFTSRDFGIRSLADRISDLKQLVYLYPDLPKNQVFGKYCTPYTENQHPPVNGYVKPMLVQQVPGLSGSCCMDSNPSTPQNYPHSPEAGYPDHSSLGSSDDLLMAGVFSLSEAEYMELLPGDIDNPIDFTSLNELMNFESA